MDTQNRMYRSATPVRQGRVAGLAMVFAVGLAGGSLPGVAADAPEIVSRDAWKAKPANVKLMKPQTPREIIVHHTSVRQQPKISLERKMRGLQSFSQRKGKVGKRTKPAWGDGPYHYYIGVSGRIAEGRDINYAGDTNTKYNTKDRVQIVVEGAFEKEKPNERQLQALDRLTIWLAAKYRIPHSMISGHNDHASTDCPGKNLKPYLETLRTKVSASAE